MESTNDVAVIALVHEHFTKASAADAKLVWENVKGYGFDDAKSAIEKVRIEAGKFASRPDIARIRTLAATNYQNRRTTQNPVKRRIVDELRSSRMHNFGGMTDLEVINAHYGGTWKELAPQALDPKGLAICRAYLLSGARQALGEIGWGADDADEMAHELVGLRAGEEIPQQGIFKSKAAPSQSSWDAIKALAVLQEQKKKQEPRHDPIPQKSEAMGEVPGTVQARPPDSIAATSA